MRPNTSHDPLSVIDCPSACGDGSVTDPNQRLVCPGCGAAFVGPVDTDVSSGKRTGRDGKQYPQRKVKYSWPTPFDHCVAFALSMPRNSSTFRRGRRPWGGAVDGWAIGEARVSNRPF